MTQKPLQTVAALLTVLIFGFSLFNMFHKTKPVYAATFVVNADRDDTDAHDVNPGDGICLDNLASCTLRAAIEESNALPGADAINFSQAMTITLDGTVGPLPPISSTILIDASPIWDTANDRPAVVLSGQSVTGDGFVLQGGSSAVFGMHIFAFSSGIVLSSNNNLIGSSITGMRNVINHNFSNGIKIDAAASGNVVHGNYIGVLPDGKLPAPNSYGIIVQGDGNQIGGAEPATRNVISGNYLTGVVLEYGGATDNEIGQNFIGVAVDGQTAVPNRIGISIDLGAANNRVGLIDGNPAPTTIAHNAFDGISIHNSSQNQILNALIHHNMTNGIFISGQSTNNLILGNAITQNSQHAIKMSDVETYQNAILSNHISGHTTEFAISLINGSNNNIEPPIITHASFIGAAGTSMCADCEIELFFTQDDEGEEIAGTTITDANGEWAFNAPLISSSGLLHLTAIVTDGNQNSSQFSAPFTLPPVQQIYLPAIVK